MNSIYTIGHSTHAIERFLELLAMHEIQCLADVRRFPGSRRLPHFNQDDFAAALGKASVEYRWFQELGGRRGRVKDDQLPQPRPDNTALRNDSFRNYADYMVTAEFAETIAQLRNKSEKSRTAIMCSEGLYWKCHRRLISDYLLGQNVEVQHIMPDGKLRAHELTPGAVFTAGTLTYPSQSVQQQTQLF
jgi:uncharacterized protein (DUF488 family)